MKRLIIALMVLVLAGGGVVFAAGANEGGYPNKNISIVCPYGGAGGTTDLSIRGLTGNIPSGLLPSGVNMVVSNVTGGGGGLIGITKFATAKPDGYTLGIVNCDLVLQQVLGNTDLSYEQFTPPVAALMADPSILVVSADAPYDTFAEFVEYAKANPGGVVRIADSGTGTIPPKLGGAQAIENEFDLEFKYISYNGGAESVTAILSKEVDGTVCAPVNAIGQIQAGTVKALVSLDNKRMSTMPEVPPLGELYPELSDIQILTWVYLAVQNEAPPQEAVDFLQDVLSQAAASDGFKKTRDSFFMSETTFTSSEDAKEFMKNQYAFYEELMK